MTSAILAQSLCSTLLYCFKSWPCPDKGIKDIWPRVWKILDPLAHDIPVCYNEDIHWYMINYVWAFEISTLRKDLRTLSLWKSKVFGENVIKEEFPWSHCSTVQWCNKWNSKWVLKSECSQNHTNNHNEQRSSSQKCRHTACYYGNKTPWSI